MKALSLLTAFSPPAVDARDWHATEPWVKYGLRVVTLLLAGMVAASVIPINGAVVTQGTVSVEGDYKTVQHLEGGIVAKILVKNGDIVKQGDVLVQLDDIQSKASMMVSSSKVIDLLIQEARLIAGRDRKESFEIPDGIDITVPETAKIAAAQTALFEAKRRAYLGQQRVVNEKLTQAESEIKTNEIQISSRKRERDLNSQELATVMPLFEKGYVNQQRVGPLQREAARLDGEINTLKAETNKVKASRAEMEARLSQTDKEYSQQAAEDLQKVQAVLAEQTEAKKALSDKLSRTDIRAPVAGTIHALALHTLGGVVQPGSTLLQIIPKTEKITILARLTPHDIDKAHVGQTANVRFSSFDSHTTPRLKGEVRTISAAEIADKEGKTYFTAEIDIPAGEASKLESDQKLLPGMPAEVYLETRSRMILSYILKPLTDMMARAFREG
jgi:HlyD family secretion protein